MAVALDQVATEIKYIWNDARTNGNSKRPAWPMIVLRTPKGWTCPAEIDGKKCEDYWRKPPLAAEVAFVVEEDFHGQGIASILFRHLVLIGLEQGISRFEAEVLPGNKAMLKVFARAGLPIDTKASTECVQVTMFLNNETQL